MSSSNLKIHSSPREHASRSGRPSYLECYLPLSQRHSYSSISPHRGCRYTHERHLESSPYRSTAPRGGCWTVLHHRGARRRRVLFCLLAESNPDYGRAERGIRVHCSAAVVPEATLRSDAFAYDPGGRVVFDLLGTL